MKKMTLDEKKRMTSEIYIKNVEFKGKMESLSKIEQAKLVMNMSTEEREDFMKSKPAPFHHEVGDLFLNDTIRRLCLVLPRGHTKSTMAKAALLHRLCFNPKGKNEFAAWVSEEQGQAVDHLKYIKSHIEFNPALNYYFGDMAGNKWTEKEITTAKGDRIIAKGTSQRLRGRSELGLRYTKIILDDFESELNTKTAESA